MRRYLVRPYGQSLTAMRALSLLMALGLLWMLYGQFRNPATWRWLADLDERAMAASVSTDPKGAAVKVAPQQENVIPGPNDRDAGAWQEFQKRRELVTDRTSLRPREMPLYWKLMEWSRTEPFQQLERRANSRMTFSQMWEQPDHYRGKLVKLRLHVRRVLQYTAPENPLGLKEVYEAWGWTDESKSFPYCVVFPEKPAGLPVGGEVRGEIVFVGYFYKIMSYTAFDVSRGAPLLIGRAQSPGGPGGVVPQAAQPVNPFTSIWPLAPLWLLIIAGAVIGVLGLRGRSSGGMAKIRRNAVLPEALATEFGTDPDLPSSSPPILSPFETSETESALASGTAASSGNVTQPDPVEAAGGAVATAEAPVTKPE